MKNKIILYLYFLFLSVQLYAQPLPTDRGPGNPGGDPSGNPNHLGAPIDDFIWGLIILALLYGLIKWYQIKSNQTRNNYLSKSIVNVDYDSIPSHIL